MEKRNKRIPYILALIPILLLIILLALNVILFGENSINGANQFALLLASAVVTIIGLNYNIGWNKIIEKISESVKSIVPATIMLLLIGALTGTWLISGIIPTMIYYGLQILNPNIFLFASAIISAIVSLSTGSSWSTIATIGIALIAIGQAIGIPIGLIGGAIISGAYFGDKMSPLSDTTNIAAAMTETNLFSHIKYMMYTTIPSFSLALIIFLIIGNTYNTDISSEQIDEALNIISNKFRITPWLFIVPCTVIYMIIKKVAAIPALFLGVLLGVVFAIIFQPDIVVEISGKDINSIKSFYSGIINSIIGHVDFTTMNNNINNVFNVPIDERNSLLKSGGMVGMLNTILLIICAMTFSGTLESTGLLERISEPIIQYAEGTGNLVATTAGTCIFFNITTSDQYLSIVVPGRMFANSYKDKKLASENLSRTLEDSGTVTSVLIPWNSCGATQSAVLGVSTFTYLPYCFFNIISPIMTIIYAYIGIKIKKLK